MQHCLLVTVHVNFTYLICGTAIVAVNVTVAVKNEVLTETNCHMNCYAPAP